ncbi:MAG: HDOD domain-containing protein [Aquificota bacterium]|nr:HDOD domain-containing protein [Aquificota bacterium]
MRWKPESSEENKILALKRNKKKITHYKDEKEEQYAKFQAVADLFEGNYLQKPSVIKEFEIAPFLKTTLLRMISALNTAQSIRDFANIISSDVGMSAKLLRFVNSAYFARRQEIKDIIQACSYLGMENLKKFTLLVATNDYVTVENRNSGKNPLLEQPYARNSRKLKRTLQMKLTLWVFFH